jgi:hypothetical protein
MTRSGLAAYTPVELARLRLLSRATGCPLEQMLGFPWNTEDLEPEALLQMVDEMERVAALLLAIVGSEQDADEVRQLQTTFLLLDATYPDDSLPDRQDPPQVEAVVDKALSELPAPAYSPRSNR